MKSPSRHQQGVAVVMALLLTTLAITIVASLFWQQQVQVRSIENQRLQLQKQWVLRGALDWARLILSEDGKGLGGAVDSFQDAWSVPLAETRLDQYIENARADAEASEAILTGNIVDAQSYFNLANLSRNGILSQSDIKVFETLLEKLRIDPKLAKATADVVVSTQIKIPASEKPASSPKGSATIAASASATESQEPKPPALINIVQVEDLLSIPGYTPEIIAQLKDFVIVLPAPRPLNVNTALPEVLAAKLNMLSQSEVQLLVANRNRAPYRDINYVKSSFPNKLQNVKDEEISVNTQYFLVNGKVRLNRASLQIQALIERFGAISHVVWLREN